MADASRFRLDNADIATDSGWRVTSEGAVDRYSREDVTIEVVHSPKDFILSMTRHGPNDDHEVIERNTVGKVDWLRSWLTGHPSNVISPAIKRDRGVDW